MCLQIVVFNQIKTMFRSISFFIFMACCLTFGQACVPRPVVNMTITANATLDWAVNATDNCTVDHFIINIQFTFGEIEDTFISNVPRLDIAHLPLCRYWVFSVTPVTADHVSGGTHHLLSRAPMPEGTDLRVQITNTTTVNDDLVLEWRMVNSNNTRCADRYRVTIVDDETEEIREQYVTGETVSVRNLSSCGLYTVGVRAIHDQRPEAEGPQVTSRYEQPPRVPASPSLSNITVAATSFRGYVILERAETNRCRISNIYVQGTAPFNVTYPVFDAPHRPPFLLNVNSLRPSTLYLFSVLVQNTAGLSVPLRTAIQTLPSSKVGVN